MDGYYLGSDTTKPFTLSLILPNNITRGYHTLKVVAYDDVDNSASISFGVQVLADPSSSQVEIVDPKNSQLIERTQDTYTVVTYLEDPSLYRSLSLYQKSLGQSGADRLTTIESPTSPYQTFSWTLPEDGIWILYVVARLESGGSVQTAGVVIRVQSSSSLQEEVFVEDSPLNPFEE
jgi:hypothetical protein